MKKIGVAILAAAALAVAGSTAAATTAKSTAAPQKNIVQTAAGAGQFKTLVALVKQAGLAGALSKPGALTVFAPTDAAFARLPAGTLENLLKPENKATLQRILTYHVVAGRVVAADAATLTSAKAVSGDTLPVKASGDSVMIGNARVVKADILASNGVIHVIDTVLLPPTR